MSAYFTLVLLPSLSGAFQVTIALLIVGSLIFTFGMMMEREYSFIEFYTEFKKLIKVVFISLAILVTFVIIVPDKWEADALSRYERLNKK